MLLLVPGGERRNTKPRGGMASAPARAQGDANDTRPAVLEEGTQRDLQEYLRFRHLVRNLYADELRAAPIQRLVEQLEVTWPRLATNIADFQSWLTTIAKNER